MKNKYLMRTFAATAFAIAMVGCSTDSGIDGTILSPEDAILNAEDKLGITIDPNKSWSMTTNVEASVTINKDYGETYAITVYQDNPFVNNTGVVLGQATAENGKKITFSFTAPKAMYLAYVAIKDSKGYSYVKPVAIADNKLETSFGSTTTASAPSFFKKFMTRGLLTRGSEADDFVIPELGVPVTTQQIADYLTTATEPNDDNINHNNDGSHYEAGTEGHWVIDQEATTTTVQPTWPQFQWGGIASQILYNWGSPSNEDIAWFEENCRPLANYDYGDYSVNYANNLIDLLNDVYAKCQATGRGDWLTITTEGVKGGVITTEEIKHWEEGTEGQWVTDPNYVLNFKITGNYNKMIPVMASEDYYDDNGQLQRGHRWMTVTGKWTLPDGEQRIGGNAYILIANGGELNIPANAYMTFVNQARIVVMPGGKITGAGKIIITNGTAEDGYGYNGGTISIGTFCNNFGTFYNNGNMTVGTLEGPSTNSIYINQGKMMVTQAPKGSQTANMRIWNNCWFECTNKFACRTIIQGEGAYFKAGHLEMSCSEDATPDPSYIYAKGNSLIDVPGAVALNNVNIVGPTGSDYAFLQFGYVEDAYGLHNLSTATNYTVTENTMVTAISNNIYLSIDNPNVTDNAYSMTACEKVINMLNGTNTYEYNKKMRDPNAQASAVLYDQIGNGNAVLVQKGAYNVAAVEASECSPGITPVEPEEVPEIEETYPIYSYAFEDTNGGDYDMNDVVIRAQEIPGDKIQLTVVAAGATLELYLHLYPAAAPVNGEVAHYEGQYIVLSDDERQETEVHAMMGAPRNSWESSCIMLNTGVTDNTGGDALPAVITIDKGNYDPATLPLAIYSQENGEMRLSRTGEPPFGIVIPGNWKWPKEYINIMTAYGNTNTENEGDQSFGTFATTTNSAEHWYNYPMRYVMTK